VAAVFNRVCQDYDHPALRFFPFTADRMVANLQPSPGWKVLDVATGTGALAVALAQAVGKGGRVMAIDLAQGMLARAEQHVRKMALSNVDLFQMDAEEPEFRSQYFHAVTCSFGLFFLPDMAKALAQWSRVTRPGGTILFSSFTANAFARLGACLCEDLEAAGVDLSQRVLASERLKDEAVCRDLLLEAGLHNVKQEVVQMGYHLRDAGEWWQMVWGSAMRSLVELVEEAQREAFRRRHLARVSQLAGDKGVWMDVEVRFNSAQVAQG
jgi:ubiquinone/menaquinone biosynthesis C-methylase UbiE